MNQRRPGAVERDAPESVVTRLLLLAALVALPAATTGPTQEPPSSLRPSRVPGKVRLSHGHDRVVDCQVRNPGPEARCEATLQPERAVITVALKPVDPKGEPDEGSGRERVAVTFENAFGRVEVVRELPVGVWQLDWAGVEGTHRFVVDEGETVRVALTTTTGLCELVRNRCILRPSKVSRSAEVPDAHRVR